MTSNAISPLISPPVSLVKLAQQWVKATSKTGDVVIDATMGNGHDTFFLAKLVGVNGKVFGFDIQQAAITATLQRLKILPYQNVSLIHDSHAAMASHIPENYHRNISAIMFNLGYLPGGDKTVITQTENTLKALSAALNFLAVNGILSVLAYPGHVGGNLETEQVKEWCCHLDPLTYSFQIYYGNPSNRSSPVLFIISKLNGS